MIVTEYLRDRSDGVKLVITRSTENKYIRKVGTDEIYRNAIDTEDSAFQYEETEEDIEEIAYSESEGAQFDYGTSI